MQKLKFSFKLDSRKKKFEFAILLIVGVVILFFIICAIFGIDTKEIVIEKVRELYRNMLGEEKFKELMEKRKR